MKPTKAKRSQRKQSEIDWYEENGRKTNEKKKFTNENKTKKRNKKNDNSTFF